MLWKFEVENNPLSAEKDKSIHRIIICFESFALLAFNTINACIVVVYYYYI